MIRKKNIKPILLLTSLLLVITAIVGGTIAFLHTTTEEVVNTFEPTRVPIKVDEDFDGNTKSNVTIQNVGTTDAYIRAKIVVNWVDNEGNIVVGKKLPAVEEITVGRSEKWHTFGDYFYYTDVVNAGSETDKLIDTYSYPKKEDEPSLQIEILAQSVQSEPEEAVKDLWGVTISSNGITPVTTP